eukprot:TRINITY_DN23481_c0_g1_i1.p1 TRINITY_DN23481_c0_g1~~TRINITY_DN23481_c0_g1_i1.p1  ORF type:complete len:606 (-),score=88.66 TRINITY_DN23481_c0_g1_i1:193-2010(-)
MISPSESRQTEARWGIPSHTPTDHAVESPSTLRGSMNGSCLDDKSTTIGGSIPSPRKLAVGTGLGSFSFRSPRNSSALGASSRSLTPPPSMGSSLGLSSPQQGGNRIHGSVLVNNQENAQGVPSARREFEQTETKINTQLARFRETVAASLEKSDRLRDAAIQRLEQKLVIHESVQTKLDRKLSEINGALRGLSDETQSQIRRSEQSDSRLWEVRHQMEDELRRKCSELSDQHQVALSKCKVTVTSCEEASRRLWQRIQRLERELEERIARPQTADDDVKRALSAFESRLETVEDMQHEQSQLNASSNANSMVIASSSPGPRRTSDSESLQKCWDFQQQIKDLAATVESLKLESSGENGLCARLEEHEMKLAALRSKSDSHEQFYHSFDERVRRDWEAKLQQIHKQIQDHSSKHLNNNERMEELASWARVMDAAIEDLGGYPPCNLTGTAEDQNGTAPISEETTLTQRRNAGKRVGESSLVSQEAVSALTARTVANEEAILRLGMKLNSVVVGEFDEQGFETVREMEDAGLPQSVLGLFRRMEESEQERAKLQEELHGKISNMDDLIDKVSREVTSCCDSSSRDCVVRDTSRDGCLSVPLRTQTT